ncbi:oligoendopeptidase F [Anaeromicropila herbilytica]|uniref:Oligopeptidase F n=1 Tax=Anaeromicropila herbilytica TaxID=2785025 RepID=A0A7R7EKK9_9FIRM|nr:oligoendopeptidase F [Anaeromicropila herbilytica]BCN30478.1 oligoendopeptidase F [Anaeromicropila herbilytica]
MANVAKLPKRNEVEQKYKWAIEDIYKTDEDWQNDYNFLSEEMKKLSSYKGKLGESADTLVTFLKFTDELSKKAEKIIIYANQKSHEDTTNSTYQNLVSKASTLSVAFSSQFSFVEPELLSIPEEQLEELMKSKNGIEVYDKYLHDILRKKEHILSPEMEELLADVGEMAETPDNIFSMFNNADIKFPEIEDEDGNKVEITHGRYSNLMQSKNRRVRKETFEGIYSSYGKYKNTLAATYHANVKKEAFFAKARKYPSSLEMRLSEGNIPKTVYTNLIEAVHDNMSLMYRYVALRKKLLKLDELHMYDLYTPIVADVDMKINYEEAKQMVLDGLKPLGERYQGILREGYDNGWIDVYENEGKRSGAYSWGPYGTHPYVLLNYQDDLNNVFTLAHEMGHAIHSYSSDETQPYINAEYLIFVAEVASTCNEALLMQHLLSKTEDKYQKAYLINYFLEQFKSTLFRQTMFAEFEMITHNMVAEGEALTADSLCEVYHKLNELYFGKDIVIDKDIDMEWSRIPHFYTPFYVYQYATGYSAAIALSTKILEEGQSAVDAYMGFLQGGSSKDPIDLLKGAGVDMATKEPINDALKVMSKLLDEMEELLA